MLFGYGRNSQGPGQPRLLGKRSSGEIVGQKQSRIERVNGCLRFGSLEGGQGFWLGLGSLECDSDPETWNPGRFQPELGHGGRRPENSIQSKANQRGRIS
ncbi:hypothetical protein ILYODFUR_026818 [Ilyodon furcidens]|uniref:Uncharacterized protein n=1 Tax=Ilyodon furcidens TaxID=33524 RepID=A0ABV0SPH8_9TELE